MLLFLTFHASENKKKISFYQKYKQLFSMLVIIKKNFKHQVNIEWFLKDHVSLKAEDFHCKNKHILKYIEIENSYLK